MSKLTLENITVKDHKIYDQDGRFRGEIIYEYVIFDDDTDFLLGQKDNFIKVTQNTGLTKREINKAIKILTRLK